MTGTSSEPRFSMCCSAGKIFLYARSPVAPKNTSASDFSDSAAATVLPSGRPFDVAAELEAHGRQELFREQGFAA